MSSLAAGLKFDVASPGDGATLSPSRLILVKAPWSS
jgi:hypothetical protein